MRRAIAILALSLSATAGPQQNNSSAIYEASGTARTEARLRQIYAASDWKADPNKPAERAKYYRAILAQHLTQAQEITVRIERGLGRL